MPGNNIRRYRLREGLTLRQLGERAGVSASLISQIENGHTDPSISSLRRIAEALGVSIFYLLDDVPRSDGNGSLERMIVRANNRSRVTLDHSKLAYELLCPDVSRSMEVWIGHLAPGASSADVARGHGGEELMLVISGRMRVEYGPEATDLDPGDAMYIDGTIPHRLEAAGDEPLVFLSALTPPVL
jgi:transcriptional regulator with XRE-family HTH domain